MTFQRKVLCFTVALHLGGVGAFVSYGEEKIDFNREIRPLLSNRCIACHGPDAEERKAGLRLDTEDGARADLGGYAAVKPGDLDGSELFHRITTEDSEDRMPPSGKGERFTAAEADLVRRWIEQGGQYATHWSYEKPVKADLPAVENADWSEHPVDRFVLHRLEKEGLSPSPRADRHTLARRIAMDLTGLPPSWEEAETFAGDISPEALSRFVDLQLAKPAFGERWAKVWLDLARYADSAGYADDPERTIWAYRDWVIEALDRNMPFDRFTIEQIAGDLLENPSDEQLIATAFHRNTPTNSEGGTNDEEFRNVAVADRVNTTMAVWMGSTMACAECHTHKYDPFTHLEYYQLFDFFNQSADADRKDEAPVLEVWTEEQRRRERELEEGILSLRKTLSTPTPEIDAARQQWEKRWETPFSWVAQAPSALAAASSGLAVEEGHWIRASTGSGEDEVEKDRYDLTFDLSSLALEQVAGLRLEVSPEQARNFVLGQVRATFDPAGAAKPVTGRFVRVELPGDERILQVAEVEVLSAGRNVAKEAKVKASSVYAEAEAARAVDGNTDGNYHSQSVFHSAPEANPWLEIDLGEALPIDEIRIWNCTDGGPAISQRIEGYVVRILDAARAEVFSEAPEQIPEPSHALALSGRRGLSFSLATASHEQFGFPAASVLASEPDPAKGWAIAGGTGKAQELLLVFSEPLAAADGTLRLALVQESSHPRHLLRHFRIGFTGEPRLSQWARVPAEIREILQKPSRSGEEQKQLAAHFQTIAPPLAEERKRLAALEAEQKNLKPLTTVPIMQDLPEEKRRETFVHLRGDYQSHGEKASAGVPEVFHPLREDLPRNRLALAHWLVDEANPLTPRVLANRFWEQLFGIGLVETSEEFGSQGELPSHPELLDWLAVELREGGWDQKAFLKFLVISETYRQSSRVDETLIEKDPFNRLLARGPRFRVTAEMVRDQALATSGLLSDKLHGPPVRPPQPALGLKAAFGSKTDWETSEGEDRHRRAIYTMWRRSSPYPSMATFDAPNREVCTVRRNRSNTPLQALVTLNDPVYVEAAQSWGRVAASRPGGIEENIARRFRETLLREPSAAEVDRLAQLHRDAVAFYREDEEAAREMAENPLGPVPAESGAETAALAAWTVVGNVVLNLDEMFLKR